MIRRGRWRRRRRAIRSLGKGVFVYVVVALAFMVMALMWWGASIRGARHRAPRNRTENLPITSPRVL
ncbi:MAG TPA: hypothetical protein VJJ54_08015, partial [Gemmatimonadales bacterium]|nr:hypothetical protein [Gemmatimonadales bacterium]